MSLFIGLPSAISISLISDWLTSSDLVNLDTSFCSRRWRQAFLSLIDHPTCVIDGFGDFINTSHVYWMVYRCVNIKSLKLRNPILNEMMTSYNSQKILKSFTCVEQLDIAYSEKHQHYVQRLIETCGSRIKSLRLSGTTLTLDLLIKMISNCPRLESLNIAQFDNIEFNDSNFVITDKLFPIHNLTISYSQLSDEILISLCSFLNPSSLLSFNIKNCIRITDKSSKFIAERFTCVKSVNAHCCHELTDMSLHNITIGKFANSLSELDVVWCDRITDAGLVMVGMNCPSIKSLNVSYCRRVTDEGICSIATGCPLLESIQMISCEKVTDHAISTIAHHCPHLTLLDISSCELITDTSLCDIATHCHNLQSLSIRYFCDGISNDSICAIAQNCHDLKQLSIINNHRINNISIACVARNCLKLTSLNISNCSKVTDAAVLMIAENCCDLESLMIGCCENITSVTVARLMKFNPKTYN
eukprot:gene15948-21641_t